MIKKFEEFDWDIVSQGVAKSTLGILAGQYSFLYLLNWLESKAWRKRTIKEIEEIGYEDIDIKEYGHIILLIRKWPDGDEDILSIDKSDRTVTANHHIEKNHGRVPKDAKSIKFNKSEFNKILSDVYWMKESIDNFEDCFIEVEDLDFSAKFIVSLKTGSINIQFYTNSPRSFYGVEEEVIESSVERYASMIDCDYKIHYHKYEDHLYNYVYELVEIKLNRNLS